MPSIKRLHFTTTIQAPASVIWRHVTDLESYKRWASAFAEGSSFEGSWEPGATMVVDQDFAVEWEEYLRQAWPKALAILKGLCESSLGVV